MSRWFTSDLHLSHSNIIRFCDRPFQDVDHMNAMIANTINDRVGQDDELWLLGDVAMGNMDESLSVLRRLTAGRIVLVAGNHDRIHPYATKGNAEKHDRWMSTYLEKGRFDEIHLTHTQVELSDGTVVNVSHFPYERTDARPVVRGDGTVVNDKFEEWRLPDDGSWLFCGHVHEKWKQQERMINVGIDAWAGAPVSEESLVALIAEGPQTRPADRWV